MKYVWYFFSYFGDVAYWLGFLISFFIIYPFLYEKDKRKFRWILYFLLPSVFLSYLSSFILKEYFKVPRICAGLEYCPETYAFPSGHATIAASFLTTAILLFRKKYKIHAILFILAILVCYSRLALGVHTIIDIVGGVIVGTLISYLWFLFFSYILRNNKRSFVLRKIIHLSSIAILYIYFHIPSYYVLALILFVSLIYAISEIFRNKNIYFPIIQEITLKCRKKEEKGFIYSPLLYALSLALLLTFPKEAFLAGFIGIVIGDGVAGLVGYFFGIHKLPYNKNKSLEGSLAYFFSTLFLYFLFFPVFKSLILSLIGTLLESFLSKLENFLLPLSIGIIALLI